MTIELIEFTVDLTRIPEKDFELILLIQEEISTMMVLSEGVEIISAIGKEVEL